jgi:hypothetical protein
LHFDWINEEYEDGRIEAEFILFTKQISQVKQTIKRHKENGKCSDG